MRLSRTRHRPRLVCVPVCLHVSACVCARVRGRPGCVMAPTVCPLSSRDVPTQGLEFTQCSADATLSPFSSNGPVTNAGCVAAGCSANQCLRAESSTCTGGATYSCEAGVGATDAPPGILFTHVIILVAGLVTLRRNDATGWRRIIGIVLFAWGMHNLGHSMRFLRACDMSAWRCLVPACRAGWQLSVGV